MNERIKNSIRNLNSYCVVVEWDNGTNRYTTEHDCMTTIDAENYIRSIKQDFGKEIKSTKIIETPID